MCLQAKLNRRFTIRGAPCCRAASSRRYPLALVLSYRWKKRFRKPDPCRDFACQTGARLPSEPRQNNCYQDTRSLALRALFRRYLSRHSAACHLQRAPDNLSPTGRGRWMHQRAMNWHFWIHCKATYACRRAKTLSRNHAGYPSASET